MDIVISISDLGKKCLETEMIDIQKHFQDLADHMIDKISDKIYQMEVERMTNDPTIESIPANKEQVVLAAEILSAAERNALAAQETQI